MEVDSIRPYYEAAVLNSKLVLDSTRCYLSEDPCSPLQVEVGDSSVSSPPALRQKSSVKVIGTPTTVRVSGTVLGVTSPTAAADTADDPSSE